MNKESRDYLSKLRSEVPSERARAATWLIQNPTEIETRELMLALKDETVPRVRRLLNQTLENRQAISVSMSPEEVATESPDEQQKRGNSPLIQVGMASLIQHELTPAIGWIQLAADEEIESFESSKTNEAVNKLLSRLKGLVAIIRLDEELALERVSLPVLLTEAWPNPQMEPNVIPSPNLSDLFIETDKELFKLLLVNVFQNAIDASNTVEGESEIEIHWGTSPRHYWVRVTNRFSGARFDLSEVLPSGRSSKNFHQGHGVPLIQAAADRLSLSFTLEGSSGVASSVIRGELPHG